MGLLEESFERLNKYWSKDEIDLLARLRHDERNMSFDDEPAALAHDTSELKHWSKRIIKAWECFAEIYESDEELTKAQFRQTQLFWYQLAFVLKQFRQANVSIRCRDNPSLDPMQVEDPTDGLLRNIYESLAYSRFDKLQTKGRQSKQAYKTWRKEYDKMKRTDEVRSKEAARKRLARDRDAADSISQRLDGMIDSNPSDPEIPEVFDGLGRVLRRIHQGDTQLIDSELESYREKIAEARANEGMEPDF